MAAGILIGQWMPEHLCIFYPESIISLQVHKKQNENVAYHFFINATQHFEYWKPSNKIVAKQQKHTNTCTFSENGKTKIWEIRKLWTMDIGKIEIVNREIMKFVNVEIRKLKIYIWEIWICQLENYEHGK